MDFNVKPVSNRSYRWNLPEQVLWLLLIVFVGNVMPLPFSGLSDVQILGIRSDHFLHGVAFFIIGMVFVLSRNEPLRLRKYGWILPGIFLFAVVLESVQYLLPWRNFNVNDLLGNVIGLAVGIAVAWLISLIRSKT